MSLSGRRVIHTTPSNGSTSILTGVVSVFICCHAPRLFLQFFHRSISTAQKECFENGKTVTKYPSWLWAIIPISHTLLILNSSINFILYCWLGSRFRKGLKRQCKLWKEKICCQTVPAQNFELQRLEVPQRISEEITIRNNSDNGVYL